MRTVRAWSLANCMRALNFHRIITFPSVSESIPKCRSKDMVVVNHRILFQCPSPIYELQTPRCLSTQFVSICSCKYANYSLCPFLILYFLIVQEMAMWGSRKAYTKLSTFGGAYSHWCEYLLFFQILILLLTCFWPGQVTRGFDLNLSLSSPDYSIKTYSLK